MKLIIQGNIIETDSIYRISKVKKHQKYTKYGDIYDHCVRFKIVFYNHKSLVLKVKVDYYKHMGDDGYSIDHVARRNLKEEYDVAKKRLSLSRAQLVERWTASKTNDIPEIKI